MTISTTLRPRHARLDLTLRLVEQYKAAHHGLSYTQEFTDDLLRRAATAVSGNPDIHHKNIQTRKKGVELNE